MKWYTRTIPDLLLQLVIPEIVQLTTHLRLCKLGKSPNLLPEVPVGLLPWLRARKCWFEQTKDILLLPSIALSFSESSSKARIPCACIAGYSMTPPQCDSMNESSIHFCNSLEAGIRTGGLTNPRPWRGRCRAGYSNTGGPPLPRKRAPFLIKGSFVMVRVPLR